MELISPRKTPPDETKSQSEQAEAKKGMPVAPAADVSTGRRRGVGQLLRETRERYGSDINRVAAALRIRVAYLEALEEGRYDDLPGGVYALGFVRAYAAHLGLDGEEAVRRFKAEAEGFDEQQNLIFPVPLAERSIPGGTMVLAAVILALCGYGLWYYLSASAQPRPERVSAVPTNLLPPTAPPATAVAVPPLAASSSAPGAEPAPPSSAPSAPSDAASAPPSSPPVMAVDPVSRTDITPPAPSAAATPTSPSWDAPAASHVQSTATASPTEAPAPALPSAPPAPTVAALPSVPDAATAPAAEAPHVYGLSNTHVRIIIHAVGDSWVQVRDQSSAPIFTRQLHAGDSYRVPDRSGLSLRTGKGTGLVVTVDGRTTPAIGGGVRNNVLLDPDRLLAGTAVVHSAPPSVTPRVTSDVAPEAAPGTTQ